MKFIRTYADAIKWGLAFFALVAFSCVVGPTLDSAAQRMELASRQ